MRKTFQKISKIALFSAEHAFKNTNSMTYRNTNALLLSAYYILLK